MSISEQVLAAVLTYGLPVLFGMLVVAAIGFPLPVSLVLVAAGSFVRQGEMEMVPVILVASGATILGDNIGYGISRWGGRPLIDRITARLGGAEKIKKAEAEIAEAAPATFGDLLKAAAEGGPKTEE